MAEPTFLSRDIDYLGELGVHLRGLTGYQSLAHELIQNADDVEGADEMAFDVRVEALVVDNNGVFSECGDVTTDECHWKAEGRRRCDFHRFRRIASGDKRGETGTTGAFGIGFISVYQITDHPELLSAGRHWRLHEDKPTANRIEVCLGCAACQAGSLPGTRFVLPWASDPKSVLRARLEVAEFDPAGPGVLLEFLRHALSGAMLFLKRLKTLSLKSSGDLLGKYERMDDGQSIILSDGDSSRDTIWHLLSGDFSAEAEALRSAQPGRIEAKRRADVTLAIDSSLASRGLLWACLPTEHSLGLPFHVNADFFPTVDRKRILFDRDYQAQWNRLAIGGAARVLAGNVERLTQLLGPVEFWTLVKTVKAAADQETADEEAGEFWASLGGRLRLAPTVFTTRHEWRSPEETHLLKAADEADAIEVLDGLDIELVHEELRPFQTLIREVLGVPILDVSHVAKALADFGLSERRAMSAPEIPECLRAEQGWQNLWNELAILLGRRQSQAHARAADEELLRPLAITPSRDDALWPCRDVSDADELTIDLFERIGLNVAFISNKAAFSPLRHLCSRFDISLATIALSGRESTLEACWHTDPNLLTDFFAWLEDRRADIVHNEALKGQIGRLRIFPSAGSLRTMDEVALPGGFDDPIGLTDLVDLSALGGRREFLGDLGMNALDLDTYVTERIPSKVRSTAIAAEKLRKLVTLLSTHLGEFRGNPNARQVLSKVSLLEGIDGAFHAPSTSYFDTPAVRECLVDRYPIVRLPAGDASALRDLLIWLGVEAVPRFRDLCTVIHSTVGNGFTDEGAGVVRTLFAHLATRVKVGDAPTELDFLRRLAWLPARGRSDRWYAPLELYASYQAYLFESEGIFLDIPPAVESGAGPLVGFLGVRATPETRLVVKHLMNSVERGVPVNKEVYRVLSEQASDPSITLLMNKSCLWIEGAYRLPQHIFWQPHPFGSYRTRLNKDFAVYRALLDRLEVQESPSATDGIRVMQEIGHAFGTTNSALDDNAHAVVMSCWQFLELALDDETEAVPPKLATLSGTKCIPNADKLLMPPSWVFFENRAGMADKFEGFLASNVISRQIGSSRAMASAGVLSLGSAVQLEVLDLVGSADDPETTKRLATRRNSIARVLESQSSGRGLLEALAMLEKVVCQRCQSVRIRYRLQAFGRDVASKPEEVPALFNPRTFALILATGSGKISWAAVARELATALLPEEDPGRFAAGLKEVLAAEDEEEARLALDELGFARLQAEIAIAVVSPEAKGALGENPPGANAIATKTLLGDPSPEDVPRTPADQPPGYPHERNADTASPTGGGHGAGGPGGRGRKEKRQRHPGARGKEILRSYVVPVDANAPSTDSGDDDHSERSETDKAGIARVLEFERQAGRVPKGMPHSNPGYDVESRNGEGVIVRYIEVKSFSGLWNKTFAVLSRTQFYKASAMDDEFWLYVVERAQADDFRIHRIPNPAVKATRFMFDNGWSALGEEPEYPEAPQMP